MRRAINIIFTVIITLAFAALAYFVFSNSYVRLVNAGKDLGLSVGFYFAELFNLDHGIIPSVNNMDGINVPSLSLPSTSEGFVLSTGKYFSLLFSGVSRNSGIFARNQAVISSFKQQIRSRYPAFAHF